MKIRILAALALVLALGWSVAHSQAQKVRFAIFEPPQTISSTVLKKWADQVNKDGAGVIEIEVFAGGALGRDPRTQLELLQNGVADIAWTLPFYTPGRFPDNTVTNLPLIIGNALEGSLAVWSMYEKGLLRGYDDIVPLGLFTGPPMVLMSTRAMPDLASLAGRKSTASTDLQHKIMGTLGAAPVTGFGFANSAEALARGSLDIDLINFTASVSFKQMEVAKHAMIVPIGPSTLMVAMNKESYARLSPAAKAVIDRNKGLPLVKLWAEAVANREEEVRAKWRSEADRSYAELSPADKATAETALAPVVKAWEASNPNGTTLVKTLREEVAKARAAR